MSAHMKRHPIKGNFGQNKEKLVLEKDLWRFVFKKEIKKYTEQGLALRGARHRENLTQKQLAERVGISQHHISEMENGKRTIGRQMAMRLAKVLHTDYRYFL